MTELQAVLDQKRDAERSRREAVRELRAAEQQRHDVITDQRKASRFRADAGVTNVTVEAARREATLVEELQRLRTQRSSARSLLSKRQLEFEEQMASAEAASAIELLSARAAAEHERAKAEEACAKAEEARGSYAARERELLHSIATLEAERKQLQADVKASTTAATSLRLKTARLEKEYEAKVASAQTLQRTLAARAR